MSYRFDINKDLETTIRKTALEQIDETTRSFEKIVHDDNTDLHENIHDIRKRCKKVRGLLRLIRKYTGEGFYKEGNILFRNLARIFAPMRDCYVLTETLEDIKQIYTGQLSADAFVHLKEILNEEMSVFEKRFMKELLDREHVKEELARGSDHFEKLRIDSDTTEVFYGGLKKVYKRGRKALETATANATSENYHELRKRIKYLWYNIRLLKEAWYPVYDNLADVIHDLSDYLGDDHDLSELDKHICEKEFNDKTADEILTLRGLIKERSYELRSYAKPLASKIYIEEPRKFTERILDTWTIATGVG